MGKLSSPGAVLNKDTEKRYFQGSIHCWIAMLCRLGDFKNQKKMKKDKTMSINKHIEDHIITGIAQVSIRDRFRPCSRDSSGGRTMFYPASFDLLWLPARRCDISGTLVVPLVVFVVLDSLLGVPIALFF